MSSHSDNRRTITEFGNGSNWKLCKVIKIKEDCILGKHYHKKKNESFMLAEGSGKIGINDEEPTEMQLFKEYFVPTDMKHEFHLTKCSLLIGLSSEEFDPNDECR
jgi:mannose-6-phosphate isomerase-like protein (cupin superfamily)